MSAPSLSVSKALLALTFGFGFLALWFGRGPVVIADACMSRDVAPATLVPQDRVTEYRGDEETLYCNVSLRGAVESTRLRARWVAEAAAGVPAGTSLGETELTGEGRSWFSFRYTPGTAGLPAGRYHVELWVKGAAPEDALPQSSVPFSVAVAGPMIARAWTSRDERGEQPVVVFDPTAQAVYCVAMIRNARAGSNLVSRWLAVATERDASEVLIDEAQFPLDRSNLMFESHLTRPTNGWPKGEYRVELSLEGEDGPATTVTFRVGAK